MSNGRRGPWIATAISIGILVIGLVGGGVSLLVNSMIGSADAYGEVAIPGSASLELPAGDVLISYRATVGMSGSRGAIVPTLQLKITPPAGVEKPTLTASGSSSSTSNRELTAQIYTAHVAQAGTYKVEVGDAGFASQDQRLLFGHGSPYEWVTWPLFGVAFVGIPFMIGSIFWLLRSEPETSDAPSYSSPSDSLPEGPWKRVPNDQDVRLEQLKTISALRDSGALNQAEFEAEKRRILGS